MSLLSWNCRGLARGQAIRALRALFKQHDPGVAFLMETKISDEALSHTVRNLGFFSFVSSPPVGLKGGLVLCWRPNISLAVVFVCCNIIVVRISPGLDLDDFLVYFIYGLSS